MGRQLEPTSLIDMRYMMEDSGMGKTFLYAEIKKGNLSQPMKFGRSSRWLLSDYEQWKLSHKTQ